MVQIAMTSIRSLSVASANIRSPQQPRALKKHPVFFSLVTSTLLPPSPLIAFPPLQPSSAPIFPSLQNVMRQAENGSGVLRGRALLLTGGILLIKKKKALLSVQEGFLPCGMCTGQMDGWTDYEAVSQCQLEGEKVSKSSKSDWQYLQRS